MDIWALYSSAESYPSVFAVICLSIFSLHKPPSISSLSSKRLAQQQLSVLEEVWLFVSQLWVRARCLPSSPCFLSAQNQQSCRLPRHFSPCRWRPSISVSIIFPPSCAHSLHYLTNDIMPLCAPASAPSPPLSPHHVHCLPFPPLPLSISPSICPSGFPPNTGSRYTSIGLWLLPFPQAPVSSLPPGARCLQICILSPPLFFHFPPSVSVCPLSRHLPLYSLSFLSSAPSVLTIYSICHPNPPSSCSPSHPSSPALGIVKAASSSWSSLLRHLPSLYSSSLSSPLLSLPPSPFSWVLLMEDLAAGQKMEGAEERVCQFLSDSPLSFSFSRCDLLFPPIFMHAIPFPSALVHLSLAVTPYSSVPFVSCMARVSAVAIMAATTWRGGSILSLEITSPGTGSTIREKGRAVGKENHILKRSNLDIKLSQSQRLCHFCSHTLFVRASPAAPSTILSLLWNQFLIHFKCNYTL